MFLTKSTTPIIGQVAVLLGLLMNGIFIVQSAVGIENIGLCIILFTLVVYLLMTPLTIQQQKFSRLQSKMSPELQAIQKKYKGKNQDQNAMMQMNEETKAVYAKYGVSQVGSCLQMVIQIPILFALYRVIWNIPAYVDKIKSAFMPLANALISANGSQTYLEETAKALRVSNFEMTDLKTIDLLYQFKPANWTALTEQFPKLSDVISSTQREVDRMNYFLGLNIADSPMNIIKNAFESKQMLLLIGAILIPVLAALTQWLNAKLMSSTTDTSAMGSDSMNATMKSMNTVMPLMSAFFTLSLPVGLGIYWIAGAVIRSIQQLIINKKLDSIDVDELVKKNMEKMNEKRIKQGLPPEKMKANAKISTRNINVDGTKANAASKKAELARRAAEVDDSAVTAKTSSARPGSLAAKANMVKDFNDTHTRK